MGICKWCGGTIPAYNDSRPRKYCSPECRYNMQKKMNCECSKKRTIKKREARRRAELKENIIQANITAKSQGLSYGAYIAKDTFPKWDKVTHSFM